MIYLPLLYRKMKEMDYILADLAELIGITEALLKSKLQGTQDFTIKEIDKVVSILNLSQAEAKEIFF